VPPDADDLEPRDLLQVVQRHAVHPVELQHDDQGNGDGEEHGQDLRLLVRLALPDPLADEVESHRIHAKGHVEQNQDERAVEEHEDAEVSAGVHAPAARVVYMDPRQCCTAFI
jgi:hypothetical protein